MVKRPPSRAATSPMSLMMPVNMARGYHVDSHPAREPTCSLFPPLAGREPRSAQVPGVVDDLAGGAGLERSAHLWRDLALGERLVVDVHVHRLGRDQRVG